MADNPEPVIMEEVADPEELAAIWARRALRTQRNLVIDICFRGVHALSWLVHLCGWRRAVRSGYA
jgi:hypothetical protein